MTLPLGWFLDKLIRFRPRTFRYERFGGIAQLGWPRALIFMDRDRARALGYDAPPPELWASADPEGAISSPLTAPIEAHLQLTNRCSVGCKGCYTGATPEGAPNEWDLARWRKAIDELAEAGVLHLALGGGESALLPWLGELARHVRARGMVPNLTTSGIFDEDVLDRLCGWAREGLFGQINVSMDGVGKDYEAVRGVDGFAQADHAIVRLRKSTRNLGINCVVTRASFDGLDRLFAYARRRRLREIELLRFKPSGRGARAATYQALRCTDEQNRALLPTVLALCRRHRLRVRLDCSYTPMVAYHEGDARLLRWLTVYGCVGGDWLVSARATGALAPCSFAPPVQATIDELRACWERPAIFFPFREWKKAQAPCSTCSYLSLCRGGCRVVSGHVLSDPAAPDPECPKVVAYRKEERRPSTLRLPIVD